MRSVRKACVSLARAAALALSVAPVLASPGHAQAALDRVTIGALRFSSSGPVFLALDRGYFRDAGLDAAIAFFQAAPTVAVAVASGDATFGVTALTAAAFNLAAEGRLLIIAGQAQEKRGHSGNLVLVTRQAYEQGLDTLDELFAQPFGLTQPGSPSHYQLGQLAAGRGVAADQLEILPFQTLPNLVAALKTGAVTWAIIAPPIATDLIDAGAVVSLAPYSDFGAYQFGAAFAATDTVDGQPEMVRRFLGAYARGLADYAQIVSDPGSPAAREAAAVVARYVYPDQDPAKAADRVLSSALYVDPEGDVDVEDVARQIEWYFENGMLRTAPNAGDILRLDLLP